MQCHENRSLFPHNEGSATEAFGKLWWPVRKGVLDHAFEDCFDIGESSGGSSFIVAQITRIPSSVGTSFNGTKCYASLTFLASCFAAAITNFAKE